MSDTVDTQKIRTPNPILPLPTPTWRDAPADHDYPAAANYLSLLATDDVVSELVERMRKTAVSHYRVNDLLRAAGLTLLPMTDERVKGDIAKVVAGKALSPVLIVRGDIATGRKLTIADGYHRICASYHLSEATYIPVVIVDLH